MTERHQVVLSSSVAQGGTASVWTWLHAFGGCPAAIAPQTVRRAGWAGEEGQVGQGSRAGDACTVGTPHVARGRRLHSPDVELGVAYGELSSSGWGATCYRAGIRWFTPWSISSDVWQQKKQASPILTL